MSRYWLAFSVVVLCLMSGTVVSADLVTNGGFETGDFTGWTQSGNLDFTFVDGLPHSGISAAWFGPTDSLGFLSQTLTTVPGEHYELRYWLQHDPFGTGIPNAVQVSWGGALITNQLNVGAFLYTESVFSNLAPTGSSTELKFGFREDTDFFQFDDVSVQATSQVVPEPGTLLLLGTGALSFVVYGWRRKPFALGIAAVLTCWTMGPIPTHGQAIMDFTPEGIRAYLEVNRDVDSTDEFLNHLPTEYHYNWIMMTDSESAQTGTAASPRIIVSDLKSTRVFGFALDSQTIEYLHFEDTTNKFRFHEIKMNGGGNGGTITIDKPRCLGCHASTRAGVRGSRPRPNWDAYDSWGGALPFNRDRIYQNSEEEKAVTKIFTDLKNNPVFQQLSPPPGIITDPLTGEITIDYMNCDPGISTTDDPCKTDAGNSKKYLRVTHFDKGTRTDEGRGVALFDSFSAYNAKRVAQELVDFPIDPVDIRPVALAVAKDCITANTLGKYAPKDALKKLLQFHTNLDASIDNKFPNLLADTRKRMESLPKLKADLETENLKALIMANGGAPTDQMIKAQLALRSNKNPSQMFRFDTLTGFMIDREYYDAATDPPNSDNETLKIALFRLYLEPLGVAVDTWSMSVQSDLNNVDRNTTYTFGDLFSSSFGLYIPEIKSQLQAALGLPATVTCNDLAAASVRQFVRGF